MEIDQKQSVSTRQVLEFSKKKMSKLTERENDSQYSLIRDDALSLFQKKGFVEKVIDFLIDKAKFSGDIRQDWIKFEFKINEMKLFRIFSVNNSHDLKFILDQVEIPEHAKSWVLEKFRICDLMFHTDFKIITSTSENLRLGYRKRCLGVESATYSKSPDKPLLAILFLFEDGQPIESINDPSTFLQLSEKIVEFVKDFLKVHGKTIDIEEKAALIEGFRKIKADISLAEAHVNNRTTSQ
jgi:hypothetical protein